jgi:hypothetical protein
MNHRASIDDQTKNEWIHTEGEEWEFVSEQLVPLKNGFLSHSE